VQERPQRQLNLEKEKQRMQRFQKRYMFLKSSRVHSNLAKQKWMNTKLLSMFSTEIGVPTALLQEA
jgi:hypothetical protein